MRNIFIPKWRREKTLPLIKELPLVFENRTEAGKLLAQKLLTFKFQDPIILALPRGGVPVAFEVAKSFHTTMEVLVARKISAPKQPEFAIGAITEEGQYWLDVQAVRSMNISSIDLEEGIHKATEEVLRRVKIFRHKKPLPNVKNRTVILVDDGLATGATANIGFTHSA